MAWGVAAALFAVALVARLPYRVEHLWAHDSVLYARAVEAFDPAAQQPHPPGYLWYVLLVRGVTALTGDANAAMTLISAVAGAVAVALLYLLGARMYDERTGRIAAVFLMTAVTFWGESAVAYPYTLLAALTTLVALLVWRSVDTRAEASASSDRRAMTPADRGRALLLASVAWGIAIGFRTDLAFALAPIWLMAATSVPRKWGSVSAAGVAAPVAAWLAASSALTPGGASAFVGALVQQAGLIEERYGAIANGPEALVANGRELARYLGRGLYLLLPLLAALAISREIQRVELREKRRAAFGLAWALAPLPLFVLVHIGEYGHAFSMLPGLCLLAARGAIGLVRAAHVPRALGWVVGAAALANAGIFLFSDTPLSAKDLARRDSGTAEKVATIRDRVDAERSVIVTAYDQLLLEHYLPGRRYMAYEPDVTPHFARLIPCPNGCPRRVTVILWDDVLRADDGWRTVRMRHGSHLRMTEAPAGWRLRVRDGHRIAIEP